MTLNEVREIESRYEIALPEDYRDFLLNYPEELITTKRQIRGVNPREESPSELELRGSTADLIDLNDYVRETRVPWTRHGGPWPRNYFVIGDNQCGDYWCIDVDAGYSAVYWYDHEQGVFDRHYESVQDFADSELQEIREDWEEEQRLLRRLQEEESMGRDPDS